MRPCTEHRQRHSPWWRMRCEETSVSFILAKKVSRTLIINETCCRNLRSYWSLAVRTVKILIAILWGICSWIYLRRFMYLSRYYLCFSASNSISISNVSSSLSDRMRELVRAFSSRTQRFKEKVVLPPTPSSTTSQGEKSSKLSTISYWLEILIVSLFQLMSGFYTESCDD